jgi:MoaA/NifB/PqqE/SkfB family radical SAM enzyme
VKRVDRELDTDEWKSVINGAWQAGIPHVVFTGGEPTLRDDLPTLIAHAESNGQVSGLLTDGLRLADQDYLDQLLGTGLDHIMIVFQADNEAFWSALDKAIAADIFIAVHLTLSEQNAADLQALIPLLVERGVKALSLSTNRPELTESLSRLRDLAAAHHLELVWDLPVPYSSNNPVALELKANEPPGNAKSAVLYVEPDGDVLPAQGDTRLLGNALRDAWEFLWRQK